MPMIEIRAPKSKKLVGIIDEKRGVFGSFIMKTGIKTTIIPIVEEGLIIHFDSGKGEEEEVYISPIFQSPIMAGNT